MDSNEQTELTRKIKADSEIESRLTALGGRQGVGAGDIKQKWKRTHTHEQQCGDWWGGDVRGINGNGKNTIRNTL